MTFNFGDIFHKSAKDRTMRGLVNIPLDSSLWPKSWKTVYYKEYTRFKKIKLPQPNMSVDISQAVIGRRSVREWGSGSISLQEISNILFFSCGITEHALDENKSKRAQASAGGRYPIEVYFLIFKEGELKRAVYHYNVKEHALDVLYDLDSIDKNLIETMYSKRWDEEASLGIIITGVVSRTVSKYGERGYRYMYLEAGAVAQTMSTVADSQGIGCVIMGGTNDTDIEKVLDIDGDEETHIISLLAGKKK